MINYSELEPYDEVLDRRLWTHFEEGLSWQGTLATRRRNEPGNAQRLIEDLIARERNLEAELAPPLIDVEKPVAVAEGESGSPMSSYPSYIASVQRLLRQVFLSPTPYIKRLCRWLRAGER